MYAVHLTVTFTDRSAADASLDQVVSRTSDLPGFAAGYWVAGPADEGVSLIMFDSEEAALGFADLLKSAPAEAGVTLYREDVWVGEVVAHA